MADLPSGCYTLSAPENPWLPVERRHLPQTRVSCHTRVGHAAYTLTLTQTYTNPSDKILEQVRYTFPLYDGVSIVSFHCQVGGRVIKGVVREKRQARADYEHAVSQGETAGLLESVPDASDVFVTSLGHVPAQTDIAVTITIVGELKHDAQIDGLRLTIPTHIAPRYGDYPVALMASQHSSPQDFVRVAVDVELPADWPVQRIMSPSHPLDVSIGSVSTDGQDSEPSLNKACATLAQQTASLERDIVVQVVAKNLGNPQALLETHPELHTSKALLATFVPKFNLPPARPEIIFICDRSGSMSQNMPMLQAAMNILLKSLPLGVKFNICSFGSQHSFFAKQSQKYDEQSLSKALEHIKSFGADYGGTETGAAIEACIASRFGDIPLELILLTDGDIWGADSVFNKLHQESARQVRLFALGIGNGVSHAVIEGAARAGRGFAQHVADGERMDAKVVRMLKGALSPQIQDYELLLQFRGDPHLLTVERHPRLALEEGVKTKAEKATISLFDPDQKEAASVSAGVASEAPLGHLPTISPPKIIQAPHDLPSMFPFSRVSVYLLLDQIDTTLLEKVILKGSYEQSNFELAIPVTHANLAARTIHQLAAKKASQELEEGRGWLHAARDQSGKTLQESRPSLVEDMVQREAVRIQTQFQVAGKYSSFVALGSRTGESAKLGTAANTDDSDCDFEILPDVARVGANQAPGAYSGSVMMARGFGSAAPPPAPSGPPAAEKRSGFGGRMNLMLSRKAAPSAAIPPPPPACAPVAFAETDSAAFSARRAGAACQRSAAPARSNELPAADESQELELIDKIIGAQSFQGSFAADSVPWADMGLSRASVESGTGRSQDQGLAATATVVLYLETQMEGAREAWELVVDKARLWLQQQGFSEQGWDRARAVLLGMIGSSSS